MVPGFTNVVTAFIFEHVVPVTSLIGYQTKQKIAARSGERNVCGRPLSDLRM